MIAIVQSCGTNISSVEFALQRLGKKAVLTNDKNALQNASHVILPGVSTAQSAMQNLQKNNLVELIRELKQPVLGICSGMQILFQHSDEDDIPCLGIFAGKIILMPEIDLPVPHMGWNQINIIKNSKLLENITENSYVYFVHSYMAETSDYTLASTKYACQFSAIVQNKNFYGVQFHPERSGKIGEQILQNFLSL